MRKHKVSEAVIRRLPRYYRHLTDLNQAGVVCISSSAPGASMGLTASQLRQDLSCFGEFGQQGYGYNVDKLRGEIADILGMNQGHTAVILGAGNLGRALIKSFKFENSGFRLNAAFDILPEMVGSTIGATPVYHIDTLEDYLAQHPASVGILTVPRQAAGAMAERLVACGIKGIWNFTNTELNVQNSAVRVESVHFSDSLQTLSYMISEDV